MATLQGIRVHVTCPFHPAATPAAPLSRKLNAKRIGGGKTFPTGQEPNKKSFIITDENNRNRTLGVQPSACGSMFVCSAHTSQPAQLPTVGIDPAS